SLKGLEFLGFNLDAKKNEIAGEIGEISTDDSRVKVYVIPTNEELMIARDTARLAQ
ncbi:MAG: acetate kinase, partial [Clostridium sp.]